MRTERVALRHHAAAGGAVASIALRDLRGRDELAVEGVDTRAGSSLLDRLIGRDGPRAATLCAADRDSLLAALHRREWGDRILSTLRCAQCGERFDLSFSLSAMQAHLARGGFRPRAAPPTGRAGAASRREGAHAGVAALAMHSEWNTRISRAGSRARASAPIVDLEIPRNVRRVPCTAGGALRSAVIRTAAAAW